jgi:uncharacterized protein
VTTADEVTLRLLEGGATEMAELQRVLEAAPTYAQLVTGSPPGPADAQSTYTILPEGKSYEDKFVFGVYLGSAMVGCIDLIRGYPDPQVAHLGLLLIAEPFQNRGIGRSAYRLVEEYIRALGGCSTVRAAVVRTNEAVLPFWHKVGFAPTGEVKPYRYSNVVSEIIILAKRLADAAA